MGGGGAMRTLEWHEAVWGGVGGEMENHGEGGVESGRVITM